MSQYIIVKITDNYLGTGEHVLVVRANRMKEAQGFEHLSNIFGKRYLMYSQDENSETKTFIFPYSTQTVECLLGIARRHQNNEFWEVDMNAFLDLQAKNENQEIIEVHKSLDFFKPNPRSHPLSWEDFEL